VLFYHQEKVEAGFEPLVIVLFDFSHGFPQGLGFGCTSILKEGDLF
jgi:hypothetical protein